MLNDKKKYLIKKLTKAEEKEKWMSIKYEKRKKNKGVKLKKKLKTILSKKNQKNEDQICLTKKIKGGCNWKQNKNWEIN